MVVSHTESLQCEVGRIGALPLEKKSLSIPSLELFTCECILLCHFSPIVLTNCTVTGTALSPTLTMGMLVIGPGVFQTLFSLGHGTDPLKSGSWIWSSDHRSGPTVGSVRAGTMVVLSTPFTLYLNMVDAQKISVA